MLHREHSTWIAVAAAVVALFTACDDVPEETSAHEEPVEIEQVVKAADLVTLARSAVERDFRGEIEFAHDPEAPTDLPGETVR